VTALRIHNTLSLSPHSISALHSAPLTFYTCGPTVYDDAHIGNFRSFLNADILRRTLELLGHRVKHVMNITDVGHMTEDSSADGGGEDKMEAASRRLAEAKKSGKLPPGSSGEIDPSNPYVIADFYAARFLEDARHLGLKVAIEAEAIRTSGGNPDTLMPHPTRCIDSSKLFVAPNAINQSSILGAISAWNPDRLQEFCLRQGISNRRTVLFLSRLEPEKRPELAVEALERLRSVHPEILLAFIGDGSSRPILEAMVRDRGLSDSVRFLGAIHDQFHIAPWALSSELLIHPGALDLTILHAFGYGLPVVTTNDKSIQMPEVDALVNGVNGLEYQDGNVGDLVACCSRLLSDSSLRARMSIAATESVTGPGGRNMTSMVDGILAALSFAAKSR
jgi:glycosyltransferase involved in cell wall biosynthesis